MTKPLFIRLVAEEQKLPDDYSLRAITVQTRAYLGELSSCTQLTQLQRPTGNLPNIAHSYLSASVDEEGDVIEARCDLFEERVLEVRREVLKILSLANTRREERREQIFALAKKEAGFFSGLEFLIARGGFYQLGEEDAWWRPGDFQQNELERESLDGDITKLKRAGFIQIPRHEYLKRTRAEIMPLLLTARPRPLLHLSALTALYTASRSQRHSMAKLGENIARALARELIQSVEASGVLVPMRPFYSLPREARALSTFFISQEKASSRLALDADTKVIRPVGYGDFGARAVRKGDGERPGRPEDQLSLLFFQRDLVNKSRDGDQRDTYIELELDDGQGGETDTLAALFHGIEQLEVDSKSLEHLPRVCAGMFAAAQHDQKHSFSAAGTFWDTESGRRLCKLVGFDPDNHRHRKRVQDVRKLLETITLHRQIYIGHGNNQRVQVKWKGPVIEPRAGEIEVKIKDREGITGHNTFRAWSIANELWNMVIPTEHGGTPSFMKIDERAFYLDESSSLPFNLYWTLVNRAYMGSYSSSAGDSLDEEGIFCPKLGTLHKWGGLEGRYPRPSRLRSALREHFDLMVEHGLLTHWKCDALADESSLGFQEILDARIEVGLSHQQLRSLQNAPAYDLLAEEGEIA